MPGIRYMNAIACNNEDLCNELVLYASSGRGGAKTSSKIKFIELHPTRPWAVALDEEESKILIYEYEFNTQYAECRLRDCEIKKSNRLQQHSPDKAALRGVKSTTKFNVSQILFFDMETVAWKTGIPFEINPATPRRLIVVCNQTLVFFAPNHPLQTTYIRPSELDKSNPTCVEIASADLLAIGCSNGTIYLWDMLNWKISYRLVNPSSKDIIRLFVFPYGTSTVVAENNGERMDCHSFLCAMSQDKNIVVWQLYHSNQIVSYQICGVLDTEREGKLIDVNSLKEFYFDSSTLFITGINTDRDIFRWDLRPAIDDSAHSSKQSVAGNRPKSSAFRRKSRYYRSEYVKIPLVQFSKSIRSSTKLHGVSFVAGVTSESLWIASSVKGPIVEICHWETAQTLRYSIDLRKLKLDLPTEKIKVYTVRIHPLDMHLICCGTNIGLIVVRLHVRLTSSCIVRTSQGQRNIVLKFRSLEYFSQSNLPTQLSGVDVRTIESGGVKDQIRWSPQVVSNNKSHFAIVYPSQQLYEIFLMKDDSSSLVYSGDGISVAWSSHRSISRFAVLTRAKTLSIFEISPSNECTKKIETTVDNSICLVSGPLLGIVKGLDTFQFYNWVSSTTIGPEFTAPTLIEWNAQCTHCVFVHNYQLFVFGVKTTFKQIAESTLDRRIVSVKWHENVLFVATDDEIYTGFIIAGSGTIRFLQLGVRRPHQQLAHRHQDIEEKLHRAVYTYGLPYTTRCPKGEIDILGIDGRDLLVLGNQETPLHRISLRHPVVQMCMHISVGRYADALKIKDQLMSEQAAKYVAIYCEKLKLYDIALQIDKAPWSTRLKLCLHTNNIELLETLVSRGLSGFEDYEAMIPCDELKKDTASRLLQKTALALKKHSKRDILFSLYDECKTAERWDDATFLATCLGEPELMRSAASKSLQAA